VLVALIGRQWVTLADEEGNRRLDNPGDFVRFEVQTALEPGVRVIPVLVDGARALREQELPSGLQGLAGLNALDLSYSRYEYDAGRLAAPSQATAIRPRQSKSVPGIRRAARELRSSGPAQIDRSGRCPNIATRAHM
jgi:hypothetical protein